MGHDDNLIPHNLFLTHSKNVWDVFSSPRLNWGEGEGSLNGQILIYLQETFLLDAKIWLLQ